MEQAKISNVSPGPCEKIFKAFNIIPAFKAMRRISGRPQSTSPVPRADPAPTPLPKTKLGAQQQPNSVVPVTIDSLVHPTPTKGKVVVGEKKSDGQALRGARNSEATPSPVSLQKPKPGAETPTPSKVTVGQNHGQGAKTPHVSYQVKPVPQAETVPPAKPVVAKGQQKVVTGNNSVEVENKTVPNSGDRFTDFINRTMLKMRATSDVGKSFSGPDGIRIKTKSSSNGGGGRSISFKK